MRKALSLGFAFVALSPFAAAQERKPPTVQIQRGRDLFTSASKGIACGTCHEMAGFGTAIGPDLKTMGSDGTVHVIVATMRMQMTNYVQSYKTTDGTFPGMLKDKQGGQLQVYDLSQMPPVLRTFAEKQVLNIQRDQDWKHPPAAVHYTRQELADLIGFLRWASTGSIKEIKPAEVADEE
jgi:hypothetical protein